ncbi:MAG: phospholipase D-like domain-containing protein [Bacilli bacterium]
MRPQIHKSKSSQTKPFKIRTDDNHSGKIRLLIVVLLILAEMTIFALLYVWLVKVFWYVLIISYVLSFISLFGIINSNKNSNSKAVWCVLILVLFPIGFFLAFLSDEKVFFFRHRKRYDQIFNSTKDIIPINNTFNNQYSSYLLSVGGFQTYVNTKIHYFSYGNQLFDDIMSEIMNAKKYIFLEYFIISDGRLLERLLALLEMKVKEGVEVNIIYDDMGSAKTLSAKTILRMKKSGINVYSFNNLIPVFALVMNYRDHRKFCIIDGTIAYTGGSNIADEYVNERRNYGFWKDNGIKIEGEAVSTYTLAFLRQWEFIHNSPINYQKYLDIIPNEVNTFEEADEITIPYVDGLDYVNNIGKEMYMKMISDATEKLYIMTPYLVLDDTMLNLLAIKAKSGVDVRIILPMNPDKKFVYMVSRYNAEKLMKSGVRVYLLKSSFLHSKVVISDSRAIVGSINMDLRSFYQQFESAVFFTGLELVTSVYNDFEESFSLSNELKEIDIKKHSPFFGIFVYFLMFFSPLM